MSSLTGLVPAVEQAPSLAKPHTTVTITVSSQDSSAVFIVYKDFLTHHSPFFNAAFNGTFTETETQTLDLPETHPDIFGLFVHWIYTQTLESECFMIESAPRMVKLWILADHRLARPLKDLVIVILCGYNYWIPDLEALETTYLVTISSSAIRWLLIKAFAIRSKFGLDWMSSVILPPQVLFDIAFFLKSIMAARDTSFHAKAHKLNVEEYI